MIGETERALECLEASIAGGWGFKDWLEHDGDLDPLRSDPRFVRLLERLP